MSVVTTEEYNGMVNSEELIGTTEYLTLQTRRRTNRCRYNRVRLYINPSRSYVNRIFGHENLLTSNETKRFEATLDEYFLLLTN